eukprot:TRINITY_DN799_c0_g4_i1.p1 TRINITY_DN799_c0_g4~~TRINITY_DN799_c0_g4_i1.p1  ORF type:complete len:270 (+),score=74.06 TRINITY_DN799_c0_g4_i1:181-990(+)
MCCFDEAVCGADDKDEEVCVEGAYIGRLNSRLEAHLHRPCSLLVTPKTEGRTKGNISAFPEVDEYEIEDYPFPRKVLNVAEAQKTAAGARQMSQGAEPKAKKAARAQDSHEDGSQAVSKKRKSKKAQDSLADALKEESKRKHEEEAKREPPSLHVSLDKIISEDISQKKAPKVGKSSSKGKKLAEHKKDSKKGTSLHSGLDKNKAKSKAKKKERKETESLKIKIPLLHNLPGTADNKGKNPQWEMNEIIKVLFASHSSNCREISLRCVS